MTTIVRGIKKVVLVWGDGTLSTGIDRLQKFLADCAYGIADEQPTGVFVSLPEPTARALRIPQLNEVRTEKVESRVDEDSWIYETYRLVDIADPSRQYGEPFYIRIDGRA